MLNFITNVDYLYLNDVLFYIKAHRFNINCDSFPTIEIVKKHDTSASYYFDENKIVIKMYKSQDRMTHLLIHEIGHWIHYKFYNEKKFRWKKEFLNEQAKIDNAEAFAEIFVDYVVGELNDNTLKMFQLLIPYKR